MMTSLDECRAWFQLWYDELPEDKKEEFDNRMRDIWHAPSEAEKAYYRQMATTELWGNDY